MAVSVHGICTEAVFKDILPCLYGIGGEWSWRERFISKIPVYYRVKKK